MKLSHSITVFAFLYILGAAILCVMVCSGCPPKNLCYNNYFQNISNYSINPNSSTPSGIKVDNSSGQSVDLLTLDARIKDIEECLQNVAVLISPITDQQKQDWACLRKEFRTSSGAPEYFKRDCLVIKIVKPVLSKCSDWQFLNIPAPKELCEAKGITPTEECPCLWRTAIQGENTIITPPYLYLWDLGRIWTGCNGVWSSPFAKCLML